MKPDIFVHDFLEYNKNLVFWGYDKILTFGGMTTFFFLVRYNYMTLDYLWVTFFLEMRIKIKFLITFDEESCKFKTAHARTPGQKSKFFVIFIFYCNFLTKKPSFSFFLYNDSWQKKLDKTEHLDNSGLGDFGQNVENRTHYIY